MPENKFLWPPTKGEFRGARSFVGQLILVAEVNFALSGGNLVKTCLKRSAEEVKTRSAVLQYLKHSLANTHRAFFLDHRAKCETANPTSPVRHDYDTLGLAIVAIAILSITTSKSFNTCG